MQVAQAAKAQNADRHPPHCQYRPIRASRRNARPACAARSRARRARRRFPEPVERQVQQAAAQPALLVARQHEQRKDRPVRPVGHGESHDPAVLLGDPPLAVRQQRGGDTGIRNAALFELLNRQRVLGHGQAHVGDAGHVGFPRLAKQDLVRSAHASAQSASAAEEGEALLQFRDARRTRWRCGPGRCRRGRRRWRRAAVLEQAGFRAVGHGKRLVLAGELQGQRHDAGLGVGGVGRHLVA